MDKFLVSSTFSTSWTALLVLAVAWAVAAADCVLVGYKGPPDHTATLPDDIVTLPDAKAARFATALCYLYSKITFFKHNRQWSFGGVIQDDDGDFAINLTYNGNWTVETDPDNEGLRASFRDRAGGRAKWESCRRAAIDCCREQQNITRPGYCPHIWDGWSCWAATPPHSEQLGRCPHYIAEAVDPDSCPPVWSSRRCLPSGRWANISDYKTCIAAPNVHSHVVLVLASYSVTIATLLPAIAIFGIYRQLQGHRISLHRNFFWSLLLNAGAEVWLHCALILPEFSASSSSVEEKDSIACRLLLLATKYCRNTNYMWMFCEGLYLHRLLSNAFATDGRLALFYGIGWGFPLLPVMIYAVLRGLNNDEECWMKPSKDSYEWVLHVPNLLSLIVNLFFLANIIRILVTKLQSVTSREHAQYRKAVRATLVLVPLFGFNLIVTVYIPDKRFCVWRELHLYIEQVSDGLQGALVALNFCFLNGEVHALVRHSYRTMLDKYHPSLRQSRGSHSFSTQTTL